MKIFAHLRYLHTGKTMTRCLASLLMVLLVAHAKAVTILSGTMTTSFDPVAWAGLGISGIDFFNQTTSNGSPRSYIVDSGNAGDSTGVWSGLQFGVNPASLSNPSGRSLQTTNLSYNPSDLTGTVTGQIGLGGVPRFAVDPFFGGGIFVLGDFSLQYNGSRAGVNLGGGEITSGWYLQNHFDFNANAFDLASVTTSNVSSDGFDLSGDMVTTSSSGLLFFGASAGQKYGTFSLHASATAAPEPSRAVLAAAGFGSLLLTRRRRRLI